VIAAPVAWSGTYSLPASTDAVAISVQMHGRTATVSLGPGHSGATSVTVAVHGTHIRFVFPGLPQNVVFEGSVRKSRIAGTVRQGALRGAFSLRRGLSRILPLLGVYRAADGTAVTVNKAEGLPPWLLEIPSGATHGIGPPLTVGDKLGDTSGNGAIVVETNGIAWHGTHYARVVVRQREIRVGATAATLTLPTGAGPFPAVAMVHGSGPQKRDEFQTFAAYSALLGIAVLADDKRGIGQSGATYPGERATDATVDVLAKDAQAEVRFLAGLPQIDPNVSACSATARRAGSSRSRRRGSRRCAGPCQSSARPSASARPTSGGISRAKACHPRAAPRIRCSRTCGRRAPAASIRGRHCASSPFRRSGSSARTTTTCPRSCASRRSSSSARAHDFSWVVLPMTHTPIELPTGLLASLPRSRGFVSGFFPALGDWLRGHGLSS